MPRDVTPDDLRHVRPRSLRSAFFRIVATVYRNRAMSPEGSLVVGGRYNPPFEFGALYVGDSIATCWAELERKHEGPLKRDAFHIVSLGIRLRRVLDLTDEATLSRLGLTSGDITRPADYAATRAIARSARAAGFEAVLAPSSAGAGTILAVFMARLGPGSTVSGGPTPARRSPRRPVSRRRA